VIAVEGSVAAGFQSAGTFPRCENVPINALRPLPLRALRVANPFVRGVLASRGHRVLSDQLVVLSYRGHRSGRAFQIPLRYAETGDGSIVALAVRPEGKQWWRSFGSPAPATIMLRGARIEAHGAVAEGEERAAALAAYTTRHPRSATLAEGAAIVVFTPRHG